MCTEPAWPARPGDRIVQPGLHLRAREARPGGAAEAAPPLPAQWEERVKALPGTTIVHVPAGFRERFAIAMAQGIEDLFAGGLLELGRSKLLMAPPPPQLRFRDELEKRLQLWHDGQLEELLIRIEEQARCAAEGFRPAPQNPAGRARKLARQGAFRKGVSALTSATAQLGVAEQRHWAQELLPSSTREEGGAFPKTPDRITAPAAEAPSFAQAGYGSLRKAALGGVHFPALSAAGPSGMRPERLHEALMA